MHTDDRFRLEPSRIEEEVPRVRKEQVREMFRLALLWVQLQKTRSVLRVRGGTVKPVNIIRRRHRRDERNRPREWETGTGSETPVREWESM